MPAVLKITVTIGLEPILKKTVMEAFKKLGYVNIGLEAELLLNSLDGLMIKMLTTSDYNPEPQVSLILKNIDLVNTCCFISKPSSSFALSTIILTSFKRPLAS